MLLPCLLRQCPTARIAFERPFVEDYFGGAPSPTIRLALKQGKLDGFSVERLMHFAAALERDAVIEIRTKAKS